MLTHDFTPAPFYPDKCDALVSEDGRAVRCCAPLRDHPNWEEALRQRAADETRRAVAVRLEPIAEKVREGLRAIQFKSAGIVPRLEKILREIQEMCRDDNSRT